MNEPTLHDLEAAPYRLLSDAELERLVMRPSLFVVKRMLALQEVERRRSNAVSPAVALTARN